MFSFKIEAKSAVILCCVDPEKAILYRHHVALFLSLALTQRGLMDMQTHIHAYTVNTVHATPTSRVS